jgi:hypothetical protein
MPLALSAMEATTCQKMITLAFGRSTQETYSSSFWDDFSVFSSWGREA